MLQVLIKISLFLFLIPNYISMNATTTKNYIDMSPYNHFKKYRKTMYTGKLIYWQRSLAPKKVCFAKKNKYSFTF